MSIVNKIESISNHLTDAYNSLENIGVDLTNIDKNIENLSTQIESVYSDLPKVVDENTEITLSPTKKGKMELILKGNTSQDGTPTPDFPQEIHHVNGDNTINICGKNLLSTSFELGTINFYGMPGGATNRARTGYEEVQPNKTYIFSSSNLNIYFVPYFYDESYTFISYDNGWKAQTTTITTPSNTKYLRLLVKNNLTDTITLGEITQPQLEQRSTATTYEPHQGKEFPLDLGSIELCKIGDYQDYFYKSGSKWYLHKEIEKLTGNDIISTLAFTESTLYSDSTYLCCYNNGFQSTKYLNTIAYCNKFNGQYHYVKNKVANSLRMGGTSLGICVLKSDFATVNDLNSYFNTNGNDIFVYMVPITPTNTEITDITLINQLNALEQAMSYDDQTNISQENDNLPFIINATALMKNSD